MILLLSTPSSLARSFSLRSRWIPRKSRPMLIQAVRFALRLLLHRPGWAAAVLLTLAVGIGANTASFSLFNAVLLRPLDYPESDRLVKIIGANLETGNISPADFCDFQSGSESAESVGAPTLCRGPGSNRRSGRRHLPYRQRVVPGHR